MEQPRLLPGRKRAISNAREPISRAVNRNEQATYIMGSGPVAPGKSLHVPAANVSRCAARSVVQGVRRYLTTDNRIVAPAGSTRLQGISHSKQSSNIAKKTCNKHVEPCPCTCTSKEVKKAACSCLAGITRGCEKAGNNGDRGVNQSLGLTVLKCIRQVATKDFTRTGGKREVQATALGGQLRPSVAKRRIAGATQQEHRVSVSYQIPRMSCAVMHTRANKQKTRDLVSAKSVNCDSTSETKIPSRVAAPVAQDGIKSQVLRVSSSLTSAACGGSNGRTAGHAQSRKDSPYRSQLVADSCPSARRPSIQRARDFCATPPLISADVSNAQRGCTLLNAGKPAAFTSKHRSTCREETNTDVSTAQPLSVYMLDTRNLPSARIGMPAKERWCASKPFPKKEAVKLYMSGVKLCSPLPAKGTPAWGVASDIDQKELPVVSQAKLSSPSHNVNANICNLVVEKASRQQRPSAADAKKLATAEENLRPPQERKTQQEKDDLLFRGAPVLKAEARAAGRGAPVLRTAARAAARAAASREPAVPTLPTCATRKEGVHKARPLPNYRIDTVCGHVPKAIPCRPTGSQTKSRPSRCLLGYRGEKPGTESPAAARCAASEQRRDKTASTKNSTFSGTLKRKASVTDTGPPRLQSLLRKTAISIMNSNFLNSEAKKNILSAASGKLANVRARTRLVCKSEANKSPLLTLHTGNNEEDVQTSARKTVVSTVRLPNLSPDLTRGLSHATKRESGLAVLRSDSPSECDQQSLPLESDSSKKPRKRPPQVPPLPLHLLPEILARKDAEEEATRERERCFLGGGEGEGFAFDLMDRHQRSSCREADHATDNFVRTLDVEDLDGIKQRRSVQQPGPLVCSDHPSSQPQPLAATYGKTSIVGGIQGSPTAAATRAVGATAVSSQGGWWGGKEDFPRGLPMASQLSPRLNVHADLENKFLSVIGKEVFLSSSISSQSHQVAGAVCRLPQTRTQVAVPGGCDAQRSNLELSARYEAPKILAGVLQEPERDGDDVVRGGVQYLNERMFRVDTPVFDILNSPLAHTEGMLQHSVDDHTPSTTPLTTRKCERVHRVTDFSLYKREGEGFEEKLEEPGQELLGNPEKEAQPKDMPVTADPRWTPYRCVVEKSQWTNSCYSDKTLRKTGAGAGAGPTPQGGQAQAPLRTSTQQEIVHHLLQRPSLNSSNPVCVSKSASGDARKQLRGHPCSCCEETSTQGSRPQREPQRRMVDTQSQKKRLPAETRERLRLRTTVRQALALEKSQEGGRKPGQKEPAKAPVALHKRRKEDLARTRASTQKGYVSQASPCMRKAARRSKSQMKEPSLGTNSELNASQLSSQPLNRPRPPQIDLRRGQSKSVVVPLPARESSLFCVRPLTLPPEDRLPEVRKRENLRCTGRPPVRPSGVSAPLTLYSTVCKVENRNGSSHLADALLLEHSLIDSTCDSSPELSVHTCPQSARTAGNTLLHVSAKTDTTMVRPGSKWASELVKKPGQASCLLPPVPERLSSQASGNIRGKSYAVPTVPPQTNPPPLSRMGDASRSTSLSFSGCRRMVSVELCSTRAVSVVDACGQAWREQPQPDRRLHLPATAAVLDGHQPFATSSQDLQLQWKNSGVVGRLQEGQIYSSEISQNLRYTDVERCKSYLAMRQPISQKQFYLCAPELSNLRIEGTGEQAAVNPAARGRPGVLHPVGPFHNTSSSVQALPQHIVPIPSVARLQPFPSVTRHSEKPVSNSAPYCPGKNCVAEGRTLKTGQTMPTTWACGSRYKENTQCRSTLSQGGASQLSSLRSCVFLRPVEAAKHRGVRFPERAFVKDHAATDTPKETFPHKLCLALPHAISHPDRTVRVPSPQQILPGPRFNPLTVICTH